jgi:hypothetical protein
VFTVAADGWSHWIGAAKFADGPTGENQHVAVSVASVTGVADGCDSHRPTDPPVGPSVDDLATVLADLAPFEVTSAPSDVTVYGYRGKHLELIVPDLPFELREGDAYFTECAGGQLQSWIAPGLSSFYGYTGPGHVEEHWILDVDGSRLLIQANWSPGSSTQDLAELRAILDSIRIEP